MNEEEREAIHGLIHRLLTRWAPVDLMFGDPLWHDYDPLPWWEFLPGLERAADLTEGRRFLDLGCGAGDKLALAYALGWDVTGVDRHLPYIEAAMELVPEATLYHNDILEMDSLNADLVYMYRPARADELEDELERHVLVIARPGTVMFWPLRHEPEVWVI